MKKYILPAIIVVTMVLWFIGGFIWGRATALRGLSENHAQEVKTATSFLPTTIYIRGHEWSIVTGSPINDQILESLHFYGLTDCKRRDIFLSDDQPISDERNSLLHELLHAGTCRDGDVHNLYWNSSSPEAHEGIYRLADYLTDLLHENPELTKYMAGQ